MNHRVILRRTVSMYPQESLPRMGNLVALRLIGDLPSQTVFLRVNQLRETRRNRAPAGARRGCPATAGAAIPWTTMTIIELPETTFYRLPWRVQEKLRVYGGHVVGAKKGLLRFRVPAYRAEEIIRDLDTPAEARGRP